MSGEGVSSGFSRETREISLVDFDMLGKMPRKASFSKRKGKEKSKSAEPSEYQLWLKSLVDETGLSGKKFEAFSEKQGRRIPESSLRSTLRHNDNLNFKVIEYIALTCGRDPLNVMGRGLDHPPEERLEGLEGSLIEVLWSVYKLLGQSDREHVDRYILKPLLADLRERVLLSEDE